VSARAPSNPYGAAAARGITARRVVVLAALALAIAIGFLAAQSLAGSAVYYLTPTEARERGVAPGQTARLGGRVEPGSLAYEPATRSLRFVIADGVSRVQVVGTGAPPGLLREGAGAVVEGSFGADGVFRAAQVIAKHDEVYEAPPPGAVPSHRTAP
jgi:cytochrome c-type biogenesis protein CcmE